MSLTGFCSFKDLGCVEAGDGPVQTAVHPDLLSEKFVFFFCFFLQIQVKKTKAWCLRHAGETDLPALQPDILQLVIHSTVTAQTGEKASETGSTLLFCFRFVNFEESM